MDDQQLISIYNDPAMTAAEKLDAIANADAPRNSLGQPITGKSALFGQAAPPTTDAPRGMGFVSAAGTPIAQPGLEPKPGKPPDVTFPMTNITPGGVENPAMGQSVPTLQSTAPPQTFTPGPAARTGSTTVETAAQAKARLGASTKAKGGTPDWLRKYMGQDTEGVVRKPPVGYTVKPLSDEGLAALNEAEAGGFAAKRQQGEAEIQSAQDIANANVRAVEDQDAINAAFVEREHQRQEQIRGMEADYRGMADELANTPITEPSMWGGENTGDQLLGRLALFLGTVGSAASGQPNLVWEKMQKDVDRNLQVQKENKALKASRLASEGSLIDMARQRFSSESAIDQVMRQSAYEKIKAQLGAYAEEAKTPERKAALESLMSEVDKSLTVEDEQRRALMQQQELQERMLRARASAQPDPLATLVKRSGQLATIAKNERDIQGKPAAGELQPVPLWGVDVPKNVAPEAIKASSAYRAIYSELAKYKNRKVGESGTNAAQNRLTILLKKGAGPGFSSDADMKLLADQVPDPSNPNFDSRIKEFEDSIRSQERSDMESVGAAPAFTPKTEKK